MKIGVIIQARMGSTRLPGKVLKTIIDDTVLAHVVRRVSLSNKIDDIIIATTDLEEDYLIVEESQRLKVNFYRGSSRDVLSRYYKSAIENDLDVIVRITSDCPLIDPIILDDMIKIYMNVDDTSIIMTNAGLREEDRTFPRGLDIEIFSINLLQYAFLNADKEYQREHVTPYIYENSQIYNYKNDEDNSKHRWTLDTEEDFDLINEIYTRLYNGEHNFYYKEILNIFKNDNNLQDINFHVKQKEVY